MKVFGGWGNEAQEALSRVAKKLRVVIRTSRLWPPQYGNASALLGRRTTSEEV